MYVYVCKFTVCTCTFLSVDLFTLATLYNLSSMCYFSFLLAFILCFFLFYRTTRPDPARLTSQPTDPSTNLPSYQHHPNARRPPRPPPAAPAAPAAPATPLPPAPRRPHTQSIYPPIYLSHLCIYLSIDQCKHAESWPSLSDGLFLAVGQRPEVFAGASHVSGSGLRVCGGPMAPNISVRGVAFAADVLLLSSDC